MEQNIGKCWNRALAKIGTEYWQRLEQSISKTGTHQGQDWNRELAKTGTENWQRLDQRMANIGTALWQRLRQCILIFFCLLKYGAHQQVRFLTTNVFKINFSPYQQNIIKNHFPGQKSFYCFRLLVSHG